MCECHVHCEIYNRIKEKENSSESKRYQRQKGSTMITSFFNKTDVKPKKIASILLKIDANLTLTTSFLK